MHKYRIGGASLASGYKVKKLADLYMEMYRKGFPDSLLNNKAFAPVFNSKTVILAKKTMQAERDKLLEKFAGNTKKFTLCIKKIRLFSPIGLSII